MLANPWIAGLVALFLWWFSTGAILWVVRRAEGRGPAGLRAACLTALPVAAAGVVGLLASIRGAGPLADYTGFLAALALWGWIELAFLTGVITGPNVHPLPENTSEGERFVRAWGTVAYHEMLLAVTFGVVLWITLGTANHIAALTFGVLFAARISAKLNLYFGVPRLHEDMLPAPLGHLASHMRIRRLNWMFPASVTFLTFAAGCWIARAAETGRPGFALLAAITLLALIEHWLMVLPLPDEKLWRWAIPAPNQDKTRRGQTWITTRSSRPSSTT